MNNNNIRQTRLILIYHLRAEVLFRPSGARNIGVSVPFWKMGNVGVETVRNAARRMPLQQCPMCGNYVVKSVRDWEVVMVDFRNEVQENAKGSLDMSC